MKTKVFLSVFGMLIITFFFSSWGCAQSRPDSKAPVITHSFAVEKGYYGYIWKIYIEAEDPDGNMFKIASVVDQVGGGRYPTDWIMLKPQYQKQFTGYIQWNTLSSQARSMPEWNQITLKVSILDRAGNESNVVVFPFTFQTGLNSKQEPPAPFNRGDIPRLGYITINLYNPFHVGGGLHWVED